jgi:peptidoglycan/xylan/chitin deacetylase (PgdA/CDA1 family)
VLVSLVVLPLTVLPFLAYLTLTPEGRLVRDRAVVALFPPHLPVLSAAEQAAAAAAAPRYDGPVMALAYHGIGSSSDGEGGFVVSAGRFGEHLATLKAAGMQAVTATQVAEAFTGGTPLPPKAVLITFDDGRTDAMMFADPLLREAGMSATMFVIAGAASKPGVYYASWDRIADYARSGRWDIQSHTTAFHREHRAAGRGSLPALTSLAPGESLDAYRARVRDDLATATAAIERHVGRRPVAFAYPFGAYGADRTNDPALAAVLREEVARQYAIAFQQDDQDTVPLLTAGMDLLRLRRVEVENWSGLELLARIERARQSLADLDPPAATAPAPAPDEPGADETPSPPSTTPPSTPGPVVAVSAPPAPTAGPPPPSAPPAPARSPAPMPPVPVTTIPPLAPAVPPATVAPPPTTRPPAATPPPTTSPTPATTPPTTPPTTAPPPTTSPPTTSPPTTSTPPTTACVPAGNSGRCPPGRL